MELKRKIKHYYNAIDEKFLDQFGFRIKDTTFTNIVQYLHEPKDSSSLAITRILFGLAMLIDIPLERGGTVMNERWGGELCHFPLIPFITGIPMPYMAMVYAGLWLGALGIMLGYKYRNASVMFTVCYWYLFLIEKSYWNNHSYLFGLVAFLLSFTEANCYWSLDVYLDPSKKKETVPYWNYFLIKYQFFILYFMAGMKKGTVEWLSGYTMMELSEHWVFDPFKLFLTVPQIDYLIVHWFIFVFDLTIAMWMMWERTRDVAMIFCAMFHFMNSRLFTIGMFPWVCLATMPLFYPFDWPKTIAHRIKKLISNIINFIWNCVNTFNRYPNHTCEDNDNEYEEIDNFEDKEQKVDKNNKCTEKHDDDEPMVEDSDTEMEPDGNVGKDNVQTADEIVRKNKEDLSELPKSKDDNDDNKMKRKKDKKAKCKKLTCYLIFVYVFIQAFLPYSHFITKGYNNWTDGLYGYSWDMMVHAWFSESVAIRVVDNESGGETFIDPDTFAPNSRWISHSDMAYQYAQCLHPKLIRARDNDHRISENLSIYFDIWVSLNRRFYQRIFDPTADMTKVTWSPFKTASYLIPLLEEASHWRSTLLHIKEEILLMNNQSEVQFFASLPSNEHENYLPKELTNATLTVLEGLLIFELEPELLKIDQVYELTNGMSLSIPSESMHKIRNIGSSPAFYMYTYVNTTEVFENRAIKPRSKLTIIDEIFKGFHSMVLFASLVAESFSKIFKGCVGDC